MVIYAKNNKKKEFDERRERRGSAHTPVASGASQIGNERRRLEISGQVIRNEYRKISFIFDTANNVKTSATA